MQQAVQQQAALCGARPCMAMPSARQGLAARRAAGREAGARQQQGVRRSRALSQRVQAIIAEPPVLEAPTTFPRGAHWQVGRMACRRRLPPLCERLCACFCAQQGACRATAA